MELLLDVARAVNLSACEEISRVPLSLSLSLSSKFSQAYRNFGAWVWAATWQNSRHGDAQVHLNEKFSSLHFVGGLIDAIHCSTFAKLEGEGVIHGWSFDHPSFTRNGHLHYRLHAKWWMRARILKRGTWKTRCQIFEIRNSLTLCRSIDQKRVFRRRDRWCFCGEGRWFSCELPGYSLSLFLFHYACALCHAWVVYAWFIVLSYGKNIRGRSSSKESDEFGSPLRDMGHTRSIFTYIYTLFFFFFTFFPFIGNLGEATRVSWYDSIGDYSYLNMTLYRERIYYISCVECTALNKKRPFIEGK